MRVVHPPPCCRHEQIEHVGNWRLRKQGGTNDGYRGKKRNFHHCHGRNSRSGTGSSIGLSVYGCRKPKPEKTHSSPRNYLIGSQPDCEVRENCGDKYPAECSSGETNPYASGPCSDKPAERAGYDCTFEADVDDARTFGHRLAKGSKPERRSSSHRSFEERLERTHEAAAPVEELPVPQAP